MSIQTRSPLRMLGGSANSGFPNTGHVPFNRGGMLLATIWSGGISQSLVGCPAGSLGSGDHYLVWSGAGRLHDAVAYPGGFTLSGIAAFFLDTGSTFGSGTVLGISGQRSIGAVGGAFGQSGQLNPIGSVPFDMPFLSGLGIVMPSGCPAVTVSFTPDVPPLPAIG